MPGSRRRTAIAVLWFAQAALFGWGAVVTALFLLTRTGDPNLINQILLAIEQAAGFATCTLLAIFTLSGSRAALYGSMVIAGLSVLIELGFAGIAVFGVGPFAFLYLLFVPLPNAPIGAVAIPVLVLSLTLLGTQRTSESTAVTIDSQA